MALIHCCVVSPTTENTLNIICYPTRVPSSMSTISQLTKLHFDVRHAPDGEFACPWLPKLTALRRLCLRFLVGTTQFKLTDEILFFAQPTIPEDRPRSARLAAFAQHCPVFAEFMALVAHAANC